MDIVGGTDGAIPVPPPDAFAKIVRATGRVLTRRPQPLLARGCVQLLLRAPRRELDIVDASGNLQRIDTRDQMGANLLVGRYRLPPEVISRVQPGDWTIDCGANVGVITSQLCASVGPTGRVWALEPLPGNFERLGFLRDRNDLSQLEVFPVAAGAEEGAVSMGLPPPGRSGWGSITKSWDVSERREVQVTRIDQLVAQAGEDERRVKLFKIDVEGYEFEVVDGATKLLREHRPLVYCEFNDVLLRDRGRSSEELLALFVDAGYRPSEPVAADALAHRVVNVLLVPSALGPTG